MTDTINNAVPTPVMIFGRAPNGVLQAVTTDGSGDLNTTGGGGGGGNVNITGINGTTPALSNPLPVELSDGTNAFGTSGNPVNTKDAATGSTGSTAPSSAVLQGADANVGSSLPSAVTNGQLVGMMADKFGRGVQLLNAQRGLIGTAAVQNTGTSGTLIASGGSNVYTDIITLILTNENSSTATVVSISDGTTTYKFALAAGGGGVFQFPTPLPATSSATAWTISNSGSVNVDAVVVYVKNQ